MPDDIDDLLRRTMKTLDDQVPSGYFEALPQRTLARLEASMQSGTSKATEPASTGVPPPREEDSGLHDIRALAQSTKTRLSGKRQTTNPPLSDEDMIASSSAGWKAVALPEPAKMVSLPELDELPSKKEVLAKAKEQPAAVAMREPFARSAAPQKSRKLLAFVGLGLAAAAGVTLFVMTRSGEKTATKSVAAMDQIATPVEREKAPAPAPVQQIAAPTGAAAPAATPPPADEPKPEEPPPPQSPSRVATAPKLKAPAKHASKGAAVETKNAETKPEPDKKTAAKAEDKKDDGSEPSFDQLLKEAGVDQSKKVQKVHLEKKELTGDDFKRGMGAVSSRAQGCYKGTQGTVAFKVTIAPSGSVQKVSVTGQFAGKPEGDCVAKAVQGAKFTPWDGAPQSFTYSYLLSE